jgi:hypothetical protein
MMEAARTSETSVDNYIHGSTSQKTILNIALLMEAARTYETSVDNYFTRQYIPEDNSEHRPDDGGSTYL